MNTNELSEKMVSILQMFIGKNMSEFPLPCVTQWLNGKLIDIERGRIEIEYIVRQDMMNPGGFLHGGIQGTILDDAMGTICATLGYETALLSLNLNVDFVGTATAFEKIIAVAEVFKEGKSVVHTTGILKNSKGDIIAKAQSNNIISSKPAAYVELLNSEK